MNYFAECLAKFRSQTEDFKEAFGGVETYAAVKELEDKYKIKLSFLVILVAIGELEEEDIEEYLTIKFKIAPDIAKQIKEEVVNKVIDPAYEKIMPTDDSEDEEGERPLISKEDIINLFTKRLIESLKAPADIINGLNIAIFQKLNEEDDLEEKIINILYNNEEKLTNSHIMLGDREVAPTIANWIKDFIKLNGSEMFDDLALAQYLSTSPNAKKLNSEEKNLVRRVLKLYNNLSFFPESMENQQVSDWQLIPYDKSAIKSGEIIDVLSDETPAKKNSTPRTLASKAPAVKSKAPVTKAKAITQNEKSVEDKTKKIMSPIEELQEALTEYAPGSLGYKAVVQEIERLKKKK